MYAVNSGSNPFSDLGFIPQYFSLSVWELSRHKAIAWSSRTASLNTTVFRELFEYIWTFNVVFSIALYHRGTVLWMEQNLLPSYLMPPALVSSLCILVLFRVRTVLNSWNLPSNFPDLKKVLKIEVKSGKLVTSLEFFFFFQSYNKCFISEFFPRGQIVFNLARIEDI